MAEAAMSVEAQIRDLEQIRDGAARELEKEKAEVSAEKAKLSAKRTQRLALAAEEAQMSAAVAARHATDTSASPSTLTGASCSTAPPSQRCPSRRRSDRSCSPQG